MEAKDPYLLLIEDALGRLTLKYKSEFRYEIHKTNLGYTFTIYQNQIPIFFKELPIVEGENQISVLHYQVIRDFMTGGLERILMQKENEKRLFPKPHTEVKDNPIHATKSKW